jgi:hypothetical protein
MARPTCPLLSIETSTPSRPPATLATWFRVSETAKVEDRISSPISRCTIESWASLARLAHKIAANATAITAGRPKNQAAVAATAGAMVSTENMMSWGARDLSQVPMPIATMLPPATATASEARAKCLETPNFSVCSTNAKKKNV